MHHYSFSIIPKKSFSLKKNVINKRKSENNTRRFLFNEFNETNNKFLSGKKIVKKD